MTIDATRVVEVEKVPSRIELKILLIKLGMTGKDLARRLRCHRCSIYTAISRNDSPGIRKKIETFYRQNNKKVA